MKVLMRILYISAIVLSLFAAIGGIIVIVFQQDLKVLNGYPNEAVHIFSFPISAVISILSAVIVSALMPLSVEVRSFKVWLSILLLAVIIVLLPPLDLIITPLQSVWVGPFSESHIASLTSVNNLCTIPVFISEISRSLIILVCGINLGYKKQRTK